MSNDNWAYVPHRVVELHVKYAGDAYSLVAAEPRAPEWTIQTEEVGPVMFKRAGFWDAIGAEEGLLPAIGKWGRGAQKFIGGPNPLTAAILGGSLGAGIGYGGGWLANKLGLAKKEAARRWALMGALGGAAVPSYIHGAPNVSELGWRGIFQPSRLQGREGPLPHVYRAEIGQPPRKGDYGPFKEKARVPDDYWQKASSVDIKGVLDRITERTGLKCAAAYDEMFDFPEHPSAGGAQLQRIPRDEWNRVITRDPRLNAIEKAMAVAPVFGASAARGSRFVSPRDVGIVAANAGLGAGIGYVAGKFLALSNPLQVGLQRAGLLAGAIRGVMGMTR